MVGTTKAAPLCATTGQRRKNATLGEHPRSASCPRDHAAAPAPGSRPETPPAHAATAAAATTARGKRCESNGTMGKNPEKGMTTTTVMRYRRKVPATEDATGKHARAKAADNQLEHRQAEPVPNDGKRADTDVDTRASTDTTRPLSPPRHPSPPPNQPTKRVTAGYVRKKKPRAAAAMNEAGVEEMPAMAKPEEPAASEKEKDINRGDTKKQKKKKRQLQAPDQAVSTATITRGNSSNNQDHVHDTVDEITHQQALAPVVSKSNITATHSGGPKRKSQGSGPNKKERPSLMKQLLWKAKHPTTSTVVAATVKGNTPLPNTVTVPALPSPSTSSSSSSSSQPRKALKAAKATATATRSLQPTTNRDDDEERAYTIRERTNLKLQASKNVQQQRQKRRADRNTTTNGNTQDQADQEAQSIDPSPSVPTAASSQETQSASDDEGDADFSPFQNLVPSATPDHVSAPACAQVPAVWFPASFPLPCIADAVANGVTRHEVLLEDFVFHPAQLHVQAGDLVVWNVSAHTLGMVEHSLEVALVRPSKSNNGTDTDQVTRATTPPLSGGASFAWRFAEAGRVTIECSVYQSKGVVIVSEIRGKKTKKDKTSAAQRRRKQKQQSQSHAPTTTTPVVSRKRTSESSRPMQNGVPNIDTDEENGAASSDSEAVFHPPADFTKSPEVDAGVCRAVLSQLDEVSTMALGARSVILIGDVECPLVGGTRDGERRVQPVSTAQHSPFVNADDKCGRPETPTDEVLSGTEDEDDDERGGELGDFQQKIIGMLERSEKLRSRHRNSFRQDASGFDAGATYDFFKQRFSKVQNEERQIVYSVCPEPLHGSGVGLTDVVTLFARSTV